MYQGAGVVGLNEQEIEATDTADIEVEATGSQQGAATGPMHGETGKATEAQDI